MIEADMQQICLNHGLDSEAASFMAFVKDLVIRTLVKLAEALSLTLRYAELKQKITSYLQKTATSV